MAAGQGLSGDCLWDAYRENKGNELTRLGERMLVSLAAEHGISTEKEGEGRSDSESKRLRET